MLFRKFILILITLTAVFGFSHNIALAQQGTDLFRGKEISLLIGASPGGGYDIYTRLLSRHYGRLLPGNPSMVARNVPGAGGLKLANQIYNLSPKDGTELASFGTPVALEPLFGNREAKFDTTKFTWIGNMDSSDAAACGSWKNSGIKTWGDMKTREITTFGASGPSSATSIDAKVVGVLLGVNIKVIHGYQGTQTSNLAMQRGELDATCGFNVSTIRSQFFQAVESGDMIVWMTFGKERAKEYPNVPTIYEAVKNDADRKLAELVFEQVTIARPLSAPPGLSAERTAALRNGFMATMKDQVFLAEAAKIGLSIQPVDGEEIQGQYKAFYSLPKEVVDRTVEVIGGRVSE